MRVLVTGGSGSFGQAFVRRLIKHHGPLHRLVVFSRGEHTQEQMARDIQHQALRFFIGDVRDQARLEMAMRDIEVVVHAAALKIVPTAEYNPTECTKTNIGGAENVVRAAIRSGVREVIALSTDKACNPINLYGASKLAAEKIFIAANNLSGRGGCRFNVVRYGNVLGSRGSVVPLFTALKAQGQPLPITDERMTRFWITMDQATALVMRVMGGERRGAIFVPKIPSMRITDLAEAIDPGGARKMVGIRPGEKLHETLLTVDESPLSTEFPDAYVINGHEATPLPDGFSYTSDTNKDWLTVEQMRAMI